MKFASTATKLAACAAAAVTVFGVTAATANAGVPNDPSATTYTPTGGSGVDFVGSNVTFTDVTATTFLGTHPTLTCSTFDLIGNVISSGTSRAYGVNAGDLGTLSATGCTNGIVGSTTVTPTGTWHVAITGYIDGTNWHAQLNNIGANVTSAGCSFPVAGNVNGTFNDSTQVFTPAAGTGTGASTVTLTGTPSGSSCGLLGVNNGDLVSIAGTWTNTPPTGSSPIVITNP